MENPVKSYALVLSIALGLGLLAVLPAKAADPDDTQRSSDGQEADEVKAGAGTSGGSSSGESSAKESKPKYPPFSEVLEDATTIEGMIKLYRKDEKLYGEITSSTLDKDLIVLIAIARGIGQPPILGGMTWGVGDDWIWQFRKEGDNIQIVRRNVRFTANEGSPEAEAVHLAYTDSVLFSLPIATRSSSGGYVVDLSPVFMSDLPQISSVLRGFVFSREKSSWESVKGFKENVEIQVAATYASSGSVEMDTVPDTRGVTIGIHYSISRLPETGYQPRLADDRVGYFLTVLKDFSKEMREDQFVRYVNRWDLRKADTSADLSPPKKPIIFWLEKTVPFEYRKPVREGILEWNKAFEKVGFANAIEVRQQPDDADWDPEDIRYNTFRWITSNAGFAMGPSRVNPTTGEILDADIIFDADFLDSWRWQYDVLTPEREAAATARLPGLDLRPGRAGGVESWFAYRHVNDREFSRGMARQLAFGSLVLADDGESPSKEEEARAKEEIKRLIMQGMKEAVMHEVGHTLGLRHNFKASTWLSLEEANDPKKTRETGLAASVMDYLPANFVPKGQKQGDYYSRTIGPYDEWAIEYGYKPLSGGTHGEVAELRKIASRCAEPAFHYATDEDTRDSDPDPLTARFDLGKDPLEYAKLRVELINEQLPKLVDRMVKKGEAYDRARRGFNTLLRYHADAMQIAARFVGGIYVHRDHKGDPNARPPMVVVEPQRQRQALALLKEEVFSPKSYEFPPELYNHLAETKWSHWGLEPSTREDYPVHEVILSWQDRVLGRLLSSTTLDRLIDSEVQVPSNKDAFTAAELMEELTGAVFAETEKLRDGKYTNRKPAISSLRRSLQRRYLERLANLAMGRSAAPEDCQTLAYAELQSLEARINEVLARKAQLDSYTRAHLEESAARIRKVLDARLQLASP